MPTYSVADKLPESDEGKFVEGKMSDRVGYWSGQQMFVDKIFDKYLIRNISVSLLAHGTSYSKYKVTVLEP